MNGIILVKKPKGMTSFQCVSQVKRKFNERKAGHSGTLDPNAEGFMIVALGKCTKYLQFCVSNHKHYIAQFSLGKNYDTQDVWGKVIAEKEYQTHSQEELDMISERFIGDTKQIPPMYSAIKKNGKKLYEYARNGIEVEREARNIHIDSLIVKQLDENLYEMDAVVSSGTYIRTLIEDYCKQMNELGYMTSLVRSGIEHLSLEDAVEIENVNEERCIDPLKVFDPKWKIVETEQVEDIKNGKVIHLKDSGEKVILVHENEILAAYELKNDTLYHCVRGLF